MTTKTSTATSQAVEKAAAQTPKMLVEEYSASFAAVLPSHITKPETWIRLAQGALKKGQRLPSGQTVLERAAVNNPGQFLATLLDCARLGLEPGTEQYYLTPRPVKGKDEIVGIVGYQGLIELMYRAGAVSSVVAEVVRTKDRFHFKPGVDEIPQHEIDWDSTDRGDLRLVYAFARMKDGAFSKVIVLGPGDIARIKAKAQNPDGKYSPWVNQPDAMWLKSAVRQLAKWVPTSSEYIREQLRIARDVAEEGPDRPIDAPDLPPGVDVTGGLDDDDVLDVESYEEAPPYEYAPGEEPFDEDGFTS